MNLKPVFVIFIIIFSVSIVSATTYNVGSGGDFSTLQNCVDSANPGDTCLVSPGTYNERITVDGSGITIIANGNVKNKGFQVNGNGNTIRGFEISDSSSNAGLQVEGNNNLLEENEIYHMKQDGIWFFGRDNTYRNNYIHDILYPGFSGDPHADCFQTWGGFAPTTNALFVDNVCIHNRESGSNQIVMLERKNSNEVRDIIFRNNVFVMYDPGQSKMNFNRKSGQLPISNIIIENNNFIHLNGFGTDAVKFSNIDGGSVKNNIFYNYGDGDTYFKPLNSNGISASNNLVYMTDGKSPSGGQNPNDLWMVDPQFIDFSGGNYRLKTTSPACNGGTGGTYVGAYSCDGSSDTCYDGIQNQGETGVDCGGPCAACNSAGPDTNGDGCVNIAEIVAYVELWQNGQVTIAQVVAGVEQWQQGCP